MSASPQKKPRLNSTLHGGPFEGMVFIVSSSCNELEQELKDLIVRNGGKIVTSLDNGVTHLVVPAGEEESADCSEARSKGVSVVNAAFIHTKLGTVMPLAQVDELVPPTQPAELSLAAIEEMVEEEDADRLYPDWPFAQEPQRFTSLGLPLVFYFRNTPNPSSEAIKVLKKLQSLIKGRDGFYGAGGGRITMFMLGAFRDCAYDLSFVTSLFNLKADLIPPKMTWCCTIDPCHQNMFPRSAISGEKYTSLMRSIVQTLAEAGAKTFGYPVPQHSHQDFDYFVKSPHLLFLRMYPDYIHCGDCPQDCPRDGSMLIEINPKNGEATEAWSRLDSEPSICLFHLSSSELIAFVNWDYLQ